MYNVCIANGQASTPIAGAGQQDTCHYTTKVVNKILFHQKHVLFVVNLAARENFSELTPDLSRASPPQDLCSQDRFAERPAPVLGVEETAPEALLRLADRRVREMLHLILSSSEDIVTRPKRTVVVPHPHRRVRGARGHLFSAPHRGHRLGSALTLSLQSTASLSPLGGRPEELP